MVHSILSTLSVAAFGILAARAGDLLRRPSIRSKSCDDPQSTSSVWSYQAEAAQPEKTWLNVQRHGTC
ncbi:hypothetical protein [Occallatibacter savannae]|uniref:hypothetical protein n=1 Tax=Occallatibacter savannae TaxID=1002691 RepID=UPI000D685CFB|nr:hypothetical protein [Occallatibacter savannae]